MKKPETWFEPPIIRRAKAVAHILRNLLEVKIYPDELLVGNITSKRIRAIIYPEFTGLLIWPELESIANRGTNPLHITKDEIEELDKEIFPFWDGKILVAS